MMHAATSVCTSRWTAILHLRAGDFLRTKALILGILPVRTEYGAMLLE